ncbi:MAG: class I SAM-dependent methyltransferase [Gammaproteobacteria bacterium]|nr:MAG: class I SAM-dependent methyltransferase [Gammaproteobacteria bacterium]
MPNVVEVVVNDQYENYPYPERNPENEKNQLLFTIVDDLEIVNSIGLKGKADFDNFQVLVAGGGTGDGLIYLAEQLRNFPNSKIVYCDLSAASMKIAQERAVVRKLDNITWLNKSIFELEEYTERFDYINCSGVLHHLENPNSGLDYLKKLLKSDGVLGVMLYAKVGRTAVYQIQELMKMIASDETDLKRKISLVKDTVDNRPQTNWWNHSQSFLFDYDNGGEAGVVDLFLHSQDRAYTVGELFDFVEASDLHFIDFVMPQRYELMPEAYSFRGDLLKRIKGKEKKKQQAIIELYSGKITKHIFYVSKGKEAKANLKDLDNIPFYHKVEFDRNQLADQIEINKYKNVALNLDGKYKVTFAVGEYSCEIIRNIDGKKTLDEIYSQVKSKFGNGVNVSDLENDFEALYNAMNKFDAMLLRHRKCHKLPALSELQPVVDKMYS